MSFYSRFSLSSSSSISLCLSLFPFCLSAFLSFGADAWKLLVAGPQKVEQAIAERIAKDEAAVYLRTAQKAAKMAKVAEVCTSMLYTRTRTRTRRRSLIWMRNASLCCARQAEVVKPQHLPRRLTVPCSR